jgi:hypothetical protein
VQNQHDDLIKGGSHVEKEIWRDIRGYEGLYQVSNLGSIKSLGNDKSRKEKIKKLPKSDRGYLYAHLSKNGERITVAVHRLVAIAFIGESKNYNEINHKDENKLNNNVNNLEWCDRKYNNTYGDRINNAIRTRSKRRMACNM